MLLGTCGNTDHRFIWYANIIETIFDGEFRLKEKKAIKCHKILNKLENRVYRSFFYWKETEFFDE